jgi:hypothetical protein
MFKCFICLILYDRVLHLFSRLLLACILLKLGKGLGGMAAWMRGHTFPFRYGQVALHSLFCFFIYVGWWDGMLLLVGLAWDWVTSVDWNWKLRPDTLLALDVPALWTSRRWCRLLDSIQLQGQEYILWWGRNGSRRFRRLRVVRGLASRCFGKECRGSPCCAPPSGDGLRAWAGPHCNLGWAMAHSNATKLRYVRSPTAVFLRACPYSDPFALQGKKCKHLLRQSQHSETLSCL